MEEDEIRERDLVDACSGLASEPAPP